MSDCKRVWRRRSSARTYNTTFDQPQTVSEQLTASTEHSMQTHNNMLHLRLSWLCNPKSYDTGTALSPEGQGLGASGLNRGKC